MRASSTEARPRDPDSILDMAVRPTPTCAASAAWDSPAARRAPAISPPTRREERRMGRGLVMTCAKIAHQLGSAAPRPSLRPSAAGDRQGGR